MPYVTYNLLALSLHDALPIYKAFKPALLGRMVTVPYYPISDEILRAIIKLQLGKIKKRISDNHGAQFSYDDSVIDTVDRKSTRLNSSHLVISYAVFCLKKKIQ